jgi:hypothetical protein
MIGPRAAGAVVLLKDGRALIAGGFANSVTQASAKLSSAEVYVPEN